MAKLPWAALVSLLFLSGCATDSTPTSTGYAKTNPDSVKVLDHVPSVPYKELGRVSFEGMAVPSHTNADTLNLGEKTDFLAELRDRAAALGADAIILKEKDVYDSSDPSGTGGNDPVDGRRMRLSGMAIKFLPAAPAKAP